MKEKLCLEENFGSHSVKFQYHSPFTIPCLISQDDSLTLKQNTKFIFVLSLAQNITLARSSKAARKQYCVELGINSTMIYVNYARHSRMFPFSLGAKQLIFPPCSDVSVQRIKHINIQVRSKHLEFFQLF